MILCNNREQPILIECGGPRFAQRGRKARQRHRAEAVAALLSEGKAVMPGDAHATATIEIAARTAYTFDAVQTAIEQGWAAASPSDVVIAWRSPADQDSVFLPGVHGAMYHIGRLALGVHLRLLEQPCPLLPPPHVWPLPREQRLDLIEADVQLAHLVDLDAFLGQ